MGGTCVAIVLPAMDVVIRTKRFLHWSQSPLSDSARRSKLDFSSSRRCVELMGRILSADPSSLFFSPGHSRASPVSNEADYVSVSQEDGHSVTTPKTLTAVLYMQ